MKIVVTGTRGIPNILGGVETHCEELFPRVVKEGDIEIVLIRRKCYVNDTLQSYQGIILDDITTPQLKAFEAIIHTFKAVFLARFKYHADILHVHAIGPALAIPFARLLGLKVVFTHHGFDYDREKWGKMAKLILRLGEYMGVKFANRIVSISSVITDKIKRDYHKENIDLIYNGVPSPHFIKDADYLNQLNIYPEKYIFAMGRFVPEKNFDDLIIAFSSLKKQGYQLVIAGDNMIEDSYSKSLKEKAKDAGVILTGFIKGKPLYSLLSHARGFVLPSSHEGLPISLLEAMSYGLPVIVSDIPANKAVGLPDECYFPVRDIGSLQEKMEKLVSDPVKTVEYKMDAYNWDTIAKQLVHVYRSMITV